MRIICDAPGQTCNRLWTYVSSVAQCIVERRHMVILFFDWTIEDFPNLLHAKFIHYPLWHKWYLERGNGWNNYKGLTWKVTHNKRWDKVFKFLGFTKGWQTRTDTRYLKQTLPELKRIFRPKDEIMQKAEAMIAGLRQESDLVVGVHIRRGDYATWNEGRFLICGIVIFGLLLFIQPFVTCWFGPQYRLSDTIVYLLVFNIFIFLSRGVVENYISAHGLFSDVWAAWTELALNLAITLCLAPFYGIVGILLGKILSVFFIAMFWKPYFLFTKGLKKSVAVYWRGMMPYYLIFAVFLCITLLVRYYVVEPKSTTLLRMVGYGFLTYPILLLLFFLTLFFITRGMKYFVARKPAIYNLLKVSNSR